MDAPHGTTQPSIAFLLAHLAGGTFALGALALACGVPLLVPAVGATAFVVLARPLAPAAAPRSVLIGHALGVGVALACLWAAGLLHTQSVLIAPIGWSRAIAVAASMGLTGALMVALGAVHPPASASTMIVSLGLLVRPEHIAALFAAAILVTAHAFVAHRLAGTRYPLWR